MHQTHMNHQTMKNQKTRMFLSSSGYSHTSDIEPKDSGSDSEASNRSEPSNENVVN